MSFHFQSCRGDDAPEHRGKFFATCESFSIGKSIAFVNSSSKAIQFRLIESGSCLANSDRDREAQYSFEKADLAKKFLRPLFLHREKFQVSRIVNNA
jgi:hypothetical protein